ncbi:hypothetical protein EV12_0835 [Prochlorococcus sp. MIT 0701]|nr:hypothetical protein EV12_0835 [Prochlorococcus sp. MIT 0701]
MFLRPHAFADTSRSDRDNRPAIGNGVGVKNCAYAYVDTLLPLSVCIKFNQWE